jgi:hypothetical protein
MRGIPHVHSLVWIAMMVSQKNLSTVKNTAEQQKVKNLIKKTVSAILVDKIHLA